MKWCATEPRMRRGERRQPNKAEEECVVTGGDWGLGTGCATSLWGREYNGGKTDEGCTGVQRGVPE